VKQHGKHCNGITSLLMSGWKLFRQDDTLRHSNTKNYKHSQGFTHAYRIARTETASACCSESKRSAYNEARAMAAINKLCMYHFLIMFAKK
jgi:hypothetical protein